KQLKDAHALSQKLRHGFMERAQQVDFVSEHIHKSPHPVIVCGDFNDTPMSYAYHTMRNNLKDSFTEAGMGFGKTYGGRAPSYRIDYILHSPTINTLSHERLKVPYSDHFPVFARLILGSEE
ncbi:MAG: endonuclease/exonuclease/phosphatase family protein, partial [Bacteroidota bacterium]